MVNVGADTSGLEDGMSQIKQNLAMVSDTLMEFGSQMADVFSGIMLAELTWQLSLHLQLYKAIKLFNQEA